MLTNNRGSHLLSMTKYLHKSRHLLLRIIYIINIVPYRTPVRAIAPATIRYVCEHLKQ